MDGFAFLPAKEFWLTQDPSRYLRLALNLIGLILQSSSGLVGKAVVPALLPLVSVTPGSPVLDFGSIPGDTEAAFPQGSLRGKNLSLLSAKNYQGNVQMDKE